MLRECTRYPAKAFLKKMLHEIHQTGNHPSHLSAINASKGKTANHSESHMQLEIS